MKSNYEEFREKLKEKLANLIDSKGKKVFGFRITSDPKAQIFLSGEHLRLPEATKYNSEIFYSDEIIDKIILGAQNGSRSEEKWKDVETIKKVMDEFKKEINNEMIAFENKILSSYKKGENFIEFMDDFSNGMLNDENKFIKQLEELISHISYIEQQQKYKIKIEDQIKAINSVKNLIVTELSSKCSSIIEGYPTKFERVSRFTNLSTMSDGWSYSGGNKDAIDFKCDSDCFLNGIGMFCHYSGTGDGTLWICENNIEIYEMPFNLPNSTNKQELQEIILSEPIKINKNAIYTACIQKKNGSSYYIGSGGLTSAKFQGKNVEFMANSNSRSGNGTNIGSGQIPYLLLGQNTCL